MTRRVGPVLLAAGVAAIYLLRLDPAAGLYVDDAWYMVLAKALAQGDGYTLISSAASPILPAFPPGFPLLLAPVFAVNPDFPGNVIWLKAVSIAAMFGVAAISCLFLVRYRAAPVPLAAAVALITVLTPAFVFLATSTVMAECVFTLGQLGMAFVVERAARAGHSPQSRRDICLGAVIGTVTLLVRVAGVASLMAGALYLAKRRGWRAAAGFGAVAAVCYLPWAVYAATHRPTDEARAAHGGSIAYAYSDLLAMRTGGDNDSGRVGLGDLPPRVGGNLINVFGRDLGAFIFPAAYRGPGESGQEAFALSAESGLRTGSMGRGTAIIVVSSLLSAIAIAGFLSVMRQGPTIAELLVVITLGMVTLVSTRTFRYLLPLAPFIVFYFFRGIAVIAAATRRPALVSPTLRISVLCVLLLLGIEHAQYVWQMRNGPLPAWLADNQEVNAVTGWMNRNLTSEGAVTTTNPGLVYLLTGRKTVALTGVRANWDRWKAMGVRYVVSLHVIDRLPGSLGYRVLYESPRLRLRVLELPGAQAGPDRK